MTYRRNKKTLSILVCTLIIMLAVILAGCTSKEDDSYSPVIVGYDTELYFINNEYAETGDENLPHFIIEDREIEIPSNEDPWIYIFNALKKPEITTSGTAIGEDVIFNKVFLSNEDKQIMAVDLKNIGKGGGSLQESFFIEQILETVAANSHMFEEYADVDKVQFLVNGEKVESLMGHFDASEPFPIQ